MILFNSDYLEGCHPAVLQRLTETNALQTPGYGTDEFCLAAAECIRQRIQDPGAAVHFLVGGTQVNRTLIAAALRPHQGAVAAESGHIAVHESGAIESSGHKVLCVPAHDGKVAAADVDRLCQAHFSDADAEHTVQPGLVYISNSTELGTVYTLRELKELREVCDKWRLPLYLDGARLGCALHAKGCDYSMAELAALCDAFTIGGTKLGALFGEALVIRNGAIDRDFRYILKQNGGMLAKGRLLGVQFLALLEDGLYDRLGAQEVALALRLRDALRAKGYTFLCNSPTNQQFPILPDAVLKELQRDFGFSYWQRVDETHSAVRFCISWATTPEQVEALLSAIPHATSAY